jgi:hypothetical protein
MTNSAQPVTSTEAFGPSQGATVLDIGGDIGAAVVHTTAAFEGAEMEITPAGSEWDGTHVAVRRRTSPRPDRQPMFCAVFSRLKAGEYRIRVRDDTQHHPSHPLTVKGAQVVHISTVHATRPADGDTPISLLRPGRTQS